jgi:hypothetical protein
VNSFRVGLNKGFGVLFVVLAGFQFFVYSTTHKGMYIALAGLWVLIGLGYLLGACFVVEQTVDGSGEVQMKNPLGMTLKRHAFAKPTDLSIEGNKLHVRLTSGETKKVGGFIADGGDMRRLAAWIEARTRT